jgi:hypothetical protein
MLIPQDFVPGLQWGALADLLDMNMVAKDIQRAKYARMRFEQYVDLMNAFPFVLAARNLGVPMSVDAVETLDMYESEWRTVSDTPSVVGLSGQNLVAFPTNLEQTLSLFLVTNANVPVVDGDFIQLGSEVLDAVLDYSQHQCQFKQGAAEIESSMPLFHSIIELASHRNAKILALASFKEMLYGRAERENALEPMEVSNG